MWALGGLREGSACGNMRAGNGITGPNLCCRDRAWFKGAMGPSGVRNMGCCCSTEGISYGACCSAGVRRRVGCLAPRFDCACGACCFNAPGTYVCGSLQVALHLLCRLRGMLRLIA